MRSVKLVDDRHGPLVARLPCEVNDIPLSTSSSVFLCSCLICVHVCQNQIQLFLVQNDTTHDRAVAGWRGELTGLIESRMFP